MSTRYALETLDISKRFGEIIALDKVSLRLELGSFHALLGENGAGKSTLVKCIMGYHQPDEGSVLVKGREHTIHSTQQAHDLGIGMVYQHFTLIPNMTVTENLVLARSHLPAVIDWQKERRELEARMAEMPFSIPLDVNVNRLAAGEKQKVEIIKQLLLDNSVLILDEPTSVLTPKEADEVLGQLKTMTQEKGLSVLIITHKFREVMTYGDAVTVLRKGQYAGAAAVKDVDVHNLANMMIGGEVVSEPLERAAQHPKGKVIEIRDLRVDDDTGVPAIEGLNLDVHGGEILGIAGVSGNGQRELVEVLAGQREYHSGEIRVHGETYQATREDMRKHKLRCVPEEPLRNASVPSMTVADNLAFRNFDRRPFSQGIQIKRGAMRKAARDLIQRFNVHPPEPGLAIGSLSGGNVQRAVLARELSDEVDVLVVANPCFGLDFGAVADIQGQIMMARNSGSAVILVSEDLDEILELSDKIMVIYSGKLVYETTPAKANLSEIGKYMAGH